MMRFIASTEVFHLVLITEVALPPPIFSLSLFLFFFFRSIVDDNRKDWKAKRLSLISILCFFFLSFGTRFIFSLYKMYKLARSGKETTKIIL